jgi:outer membrane protein assembly factor BamB
VQEASPVLDAQGVIYLGVSNTFQAVKPDGTKSWWFGYPLIHGSPAIAADGTIYFGGIADAGILFGFNPTGQEKSYTGVNGYVTGSPSMGSDGIVYIGGYKLQAFKGTAGLAKSCWPKFHGGLRQTGRMER